MNRYNPYTVPDGFFDSVRQNALKTRAGYRKKIRLAVGAAAVAAAVLIVTPFVSGTGADEQTEVIASNQDRLADLYENDMFLLVSFE